MPNSLGICFAKQEYDVLTCKPHGSLFTNQLDGSLHSALVKSSRCGHLSNMLQFKAALTLMEQLCWLQ